MTEWVLMTGEGLFILAGIFGFVVISALLDDRKQKREQEWWERNGVRPFREEEESK